MIKKNLKIIIITALLNLLPMIAGIILWDKLPDVIPTHFNLAGEPDGFSSKAFTVFGIFGIMFAAHILCVIVTSLDPKNKNIDAKPLALVLWSLPAISEVTGVVIYASALGYSIDASVVMPVFMGILFIIIGNYLPKCRQNYTIGIKIPWTLNDEENWNKTHRFAGKLWVICGIATLISSLVGMPWILFILIGVMIMLPIIYSYTIYRKNQ